MSETVEHCAEGFEHPGKLVLAGGRTVDSKGWSVPMCGEHTRQGWDIYVRIFSICALWT
jgi:hypothetical protein